ncbi:DUF2231 domain-containing protein [Streptomyces iakyrus]|uniref:DUF2231 domain-containing protein n=1 Tax=Streptomyces iakyrus TaxID=68219 RepID=UPI003D92A345
MVTEPQLQAKRPVSAPLAGPYGHPFHPILVTVPIGAWVTSLVFDIASRTVSSPGFLTQASEWLIAVGVIGALLAALTGFLDLFALPRATPAMSVAVLGLSGYLGGKLAYRYGVRVADENTQAEGCTPGRGAGRFRPSV